MIHVRRPVTALVKERWLVVVCDDGSVWFTDQLDADEGWREVPPVPGTQADAEDRN